ncbi:sodium-coupled neutral amino acid transporter 9 isoform X1 [Chiloscyllium plagiosum]|uniref:sodium-coupled neutral amino acid transporter 9 isoform X1 n=1 Tax=Chiloscyllium plagiosum TaxID=36176 RepID=UPI001CB88455|nr:sodium-coupled neutral amino acid transporter 9 isoform X1 [Chiloscyllium plagiosum]XP_043544585.1 sodium-coupled neutral amino acid transporter 9 isoform X1 [Chiloscyllium plagiosum]XP_043544593.1 sodium-coupled neutral amino acid transporter 9 isoform X1 [Chiloscyllium plagiosum]XP_043544601.1 sodium-coupled neutral amino acid transporter 9 isoform X1 [Chiloscyllium plagiosum]XP_043544611.1 sodium-coupled neutral amino acid transporter 9 isoform X1 [Chiloscyllium plagiosum]
MADDTKPLLTPVAEDKLTHLEHTKGKQESNSRRPFYVPPRNLHGNIAQQEQVTQEASAMNSRIQYYSKLTTTHKTLVPPDHVIPAEEEIYVYSPLGSALQLESSTDGFGKNPSIVTIFSIWNTMMGTSILSLPWALKEAGFTLGIILLILMNLLMLYCCYRVLKSRQTVAHIDTSNWEFPEVCKYYFGSFGQWSSLLFSLISLFGAMIVYWVLMSNFLFNTGKFIYNYVHNITEVGHVLSTNGSSKVICPNPPGLHQRNSTDMFVIVSNDTALHEFQEWWNKTNTVPFYLIVMLLPLLSFKSASFFARFNNLGTVSVFYLIVLVTLKAGRQGFHLEFYWFESVNNFVAEFRLSFPHMTGVLALAFFIHNCVITLLKNNQHQENNVRDLSIAYLLVGLTYMYVAVMTFAAFPSPALSKECIEPNFLDNLPSSDIMAFVSRVFLLFQMTTVYPLLGYLIRVQLLGQLFGKVYPSFLHVFILNVVVVCSGVLVAKFYPNIGGIIRYSGATCGLAFVFVYPSLIHMMSLHRRGQLSWPSAIFHSSLIVLGVANLIAQFMI